MSLLDFFCPRRRFPSGDFEAERTDAWAELEEILDKIRVRLGHTEPVNLTLVMSPRHGDEARE